ncbi:MAG: hypothetical protein CMK59_09505 [Proteobacteria bacterium]|nr:hypothetical protein [Pseudomonadota bacterium]
MNNTKYILISGTLGGFLSNIPCFDLLNLCFCGIIGMSVWLGLHLWFEQVPKDEPARLDSIAIFGAVSGVIAGILKSIVQVISFYFFFKDQAIEILETMGRELDIPFDVSLIDNMGFLLFMLSIGVLYYMFLYGIAGALWSLLFSQLIYKDKTI